VATASDDLETYIDESMPFLSEKLGDLSALIEHDCLTVAQCAMLVPAVITSKKPGDASEVAAHYLQLALLDVAQGELSPKHPETLLPYSQYKRMTDAGMYGINGESLPMPTAAWLVSLEDAERWLKAKEIRIDLAIVKTDLLTLRKRNNQKWRDAMAEAGRHFDKAEQASGWPDAMKPDQMAALQRPYQINDVRQKRITTALLSGITSDCNAGTLQHHTRSRTVIDGYKKVYAGDRITESFIYGTRREPTFRHEPVSKAKDFVYVTANDFAAWLAAQGEPPSEHIAAWFDAVGAGATVPDAPVVVAPTPSTSTPSRPKRRDEIWPVIEQAQRQTLDPSDAAAIWLKLCEWAQAEVKTFPLIGITGDAIQWRTDPNDDPKELTQKGLRDRLGKQKRREQPRVKTTLKLVK
jgi:hypothetical protein